MIVSKAKNHVRVVSVLFLLLLILLAFWAQRENTIRTPAFFTIEKGNDSLLP